MASVQADAATAALSVLENVAQRLGVTVHPLDLRRARDRARSFTGSWTEWLESVCGTLGLRVTFIEQQVTAAAELASKHGPLLSWSEIDRRWIAVLGAAGSNVKVLDGEDHERAMGARVLSIALGAPGDEAVPWAVLEPTQPLGDARMPDEEPLSPQRRLLRMLRHERKDLQVVLVYAVAIGLLSLSVPIAVQALVNSVAFGTVLQPIVVLTLIVAVALAFAGALRVLQSTVVEWVQQRMFVRVASEMANRLACVRRDALGSAYIPELANRFFDVVTVQKAAASLLLDGLALVLQTVVGMVLLAFYHPLLLAFDVVLIALIALVVFGLGRGAIETSIKESKAKYAVASWLEEIGRHATTFRSAAGRELALERVDELATHYVYYRGKHWKILVRQIIGTTVLQALASAALLGVGGLLVIQRQLTLGQLVAAELIVTAVLSGIAKFGKHLESYYDLVTAVDKLGHVLDLPVEDTGREPLPRTTRGAAISLRGVSLTREGPTLDLELRPGERAVIAGANGSGKSTVVDLLYGLTRPSRGVVLVDGLDLRTLDLASYREQIAVVRGNEAFEGTVLENVRMGRVGVSDAHVRAALSAVGLLDDVMMLPNGIDTRLTQDGKPLSHGQTRRLMLARAIADRPRLLVLDEALDGVDDDARARIVDALFRGDAPWTVLVTTHSAEVVRLCETRYRIERGSLISEIAA